MTTYPWSADKEKRYQHLNAICKAAEELQTTYVDQSFTSTWNVQLSTMNLYPKDPKDPLAVYFDPFPAKTLDVYYTAIHEEYKKLPSVVSRWGSIYGDGFGVQIWLSDQLGSHTTEGDLKSYCDWIGQQGSTGIHQLLGSNPDLPKWQMRAINHALPIGIKAHIACDLLEGSKGDERLFQSEVYCATHLMIERMRILEYTEHDVYPVLVATFSGKNVRFVQVHYDGRLFVRLTKWIRFEGECLENNKLALQWKMSVPCGNTKLSNR
ncbi:MAG: hypothetical protein M1840_004721 [Geoglossum simile]|nr:MAG: hypothetical protein M1840_004721 [Geoglossum simile]